MANECIPLHEVGPLTCRATAAVTGKRFVAVSGAANPTTGVLTGVAQAGAGAKTLGVASRDAASGVNLPVELRGVVPVTCSAAIAAGAEVESTSDGRAVTLSTGKPAGQAISATSGANTDVFVRLY